MVNDVLVEFQQLRIIPEISAWAPDFLLWEAALLLLESSSLVLSFNVSHKILKYLLDQHLPFLPQAYPSLESLENTTPKPFAWAEWHAGQLMNQHSCVEASLQWILAKIEATGGEHANPSCARDEIHGMLGQIAGFSRLSLIKS